MLSAYNLYKLHILSLLLPSPWRGAGGEALFPSYSLAEGLRFLLPYNHNSHGYYGMENLSVAVSASLQPQHSLIPLIKQQVEDAHIGLKAVFLLINLIVGAGNKVAVKARMLGANGVAEVVGEAVQSGVFSASIYRLKCSCELDLWLNVEQFCHFLRDSHVKVDEKCPLLFKERAQIVFIVHEKGTFTIGRAEGMPMDMTPVPVVRDADILHGRLRKLIAFGT